MTERSGLAYALLALLTVEGRSGYDIARWFRDVASHYWAARHSQIYPELARLEHDRLIEHHVEPGDRGPERKVYAVTAAGRDALKRWVEQPAREAPLRDELMVKALSFGLIARKIAIEQVRTVRERHAARLVLYEGFARSLVEGTGSSPLSPASRLGLLLTLRRGIIFESGYVAWCDEAEAMLEAAP